MDHDIAIIEDDPSRIGCALGLGCFVMLSFYLSTNNARQALEHPSARATGDYKIICKGGDILDVQNNDIFAFFIFQ